MHGKNLSPGMRKPWFLIQLSPGSFVDTFLLQPMFSHLFKCKQWYIFQFFLIL